MMMESNSEPRTRLDKNFFKVPQSRSAGELFSLFELIFADDTALCSHKQENLQKAVQVFSEVSSCFGLKVSVKKTEVMIQRAKTEQQQNTPIIKLDETPLKICQQFKYLGSVISDDTLISKEIQSRITKAKAAFSKLYQRVWCRNQLSLKTKISVYRTMILPIITQDCETWHLSYSQFKKLEGCQYKFLRTICNKKWSDFVHYTELFDLLHQKDIFVPSLEVLIRKRRLTYFHQILNMDNSRLVKKVIFSDAVEGKQKRGRPLLSWRQCIKQDLKKFRLEHTLLTDTYNPNDVQFQLENNFLTADTIWKEEKKARRHAKHRNLNFILL